MKQIQIVRAYKVLKDIAEQRLPLSVSHKLWILRRALEPHWNFQMEKEQAVISAYHPDVDGDGLVRFKTPEDEAKCKEEYAQVIQELNELDVDMDDYKKIVLHMDDQIDLSVEDIDALSEFIDFVE